jgi:hypothetical protein
VNLYRVDTPSGPLTDVLGVRLIRSAASARQAARQAAESEGTATLTRISGAGSLKTIHTYVRKGTN